MDHVSSLPSSSALLSMIPHCTHLPPVRFGLFRSTRRLFVCANLFSHIYIILSSVADRHNPGRRYALPPTNRSRLLLLDFKIEL